MIKHIFCDLDGTLYHNGISKEDVDAIKKIEAMGVRFHIATGRIFTQADKMTKEYVDLNGYYICENGSYIYDNNHNLIFKGTIDDHIVNKVIDSFDSDKSTIYFKYDGKVVFIDENKFFNKYTSEYIIDKDFGKRGKYDNLIGNIGIVSQDVDELGRLELYLKALFEEVLDIYFSSENTLNLVPKGVSKHEAIKIVCDKIGANLDEVATMGDSPNDISMLQASKYSFAMQNSRSEVKECANYEASSVADAINQIIHMKNKGDK